MNAIPKHPARSPRFTSFLVKRTAAGVVHNIIPDSKRFAFEPNEGQRQWFQTAEEAVRALDQATEAAEHPTSPAHES